MVCIDSSRCVQCGLCADECPNYVFASTPVAGASLSVVVRHGEQCCLCGHCVAICPKMAVSLAGMRPEDLAELSAPAIAPESMRRLLLARRSTRAFKETPVSKELVAQLLEAGTHAGTSSNGQTEGFLVLQDRAFLAELERRVVDILWRAGLKHLGSRAGRAYAKMRLGAELVGQYQAYHDIIVNRKAAGQLEGMVFRNAPLVLACYGLRRNSTAYANCAIATRNMEVLAETMGLGSCWVGLLTTAAAYSRSVAKCLGIRSDQNVFSAIMVGYPKHKYRKCIPRKNRETRWL